MLILNLLEVEEKIASLQKNQLFKEKSMDESVRKFLEDS